MRLLLAILTLALATNASAQDFSEIRALLGASRFAEAHARLVDLTVGRGSEAELERLEGAALLALARVPEAKTHLDRALTLEPDNAEGHLLMARWAAVAAESAGLFSRIGLARTIRRELDHAVRLDPGYVDARVDLVRFHSTASSLVGADMSAARRQIVSLERLDPASGAFARGYVAYREKRYEEAEREFVKAIDLDPSDRDSRMWAGYLFMETEQYARAFEVLEPLLTILPDYSPALFELGRTAAYSSTRLDEGEAWLQRYLATTALQGWPTHARTWAFIGIIRERDGRPRDARIAWNKALAIDPDTPEAKEGLKRLSR